MSFTSAKRSLVSNHPSLPYHGNHHPQLLIDVAEMLNEGGLFTDFPKWTWNVFKLAIYGHDYIQKNNGYNEGGILLRKRGRDESMNEGASAHNLVRVMSKNDFTSEEIDLGYFLVLATYPESDFTASTQPRLLQMYPWIQDVVTGIAIWQPTEMFEEYWSRFIRRNQSTDLTKEQFMILLKLIGRLDTAGAIVYSETTAYETAWQEFEELHADWAQTPEAAQKWAKNQLSFLLQQLWQTYEFISILPQNLQKIFESVYSEDSWKAAYLKMSELKVPQKYQS